MIGAGDASPWLVGIDHYVWHYNNDSAPPRGWIKNVNSANTSSIAVSPEGTPWKIDTSGNVAEFLPFYGTWATVGSGFHAYEIGVGRNDDAWAISRDECTTDPTYPFRPRDCQIYHWTGGSWQHAQPGAARHVAVAPDGTAYVSNQYGTLYKWNGSGWSAWPGSGCVRNKSNGDTMGWPVIGAGPNDAVYVIGCGGPWQLDKYVYAWHPQGSFWEQVSNGGGTSLSVSADGTPWTINSGTNVFAYVTSWQPVGPWGFSFIDKWGVSEIYNGSVQDIAVASTSLGDGITIGATYGGVWQTPPTFSWVPISDTGAGQAATDGPVNAVGSVSVKPGTGDQNTIIVGTGAASTPNIANPPPSGRQLGGNGIWVGSSNGNGTFAWGGPSHTPATILDSSGQPMYPSTIVKIRYSPDATKIYAITQNALLLSLDGGTTFNQSADPNCVPSGNDTFTDLVVDPNNSSTIYVGVSGEGVYQAMYHGSPFPGLYCAHGSAPPLYQGAAASTITAVALAISQSSVVYAAFAGQKLVDPYDDFANIDATSTASWPAWTTTVSAGSVPVGNLYGLGSQGGHDWALGTNGGGDVILLGSVSLHRWDGCNANGCANETLLCAPDWTPPSPACPNHHDYHSIQWGINNPTWVYVVNDGGIFLSEDNGQTWQDQINTFNGVLEDSVGVNGNNIFANAWDVGGNYSTNAGTSWHGNVDISGADGVQAAADLALGSTRGFMCHDSWRYGWDGATWSKIDNSIVTETGNCQMAKGEFGDLFTVGVASGDSTTSILHSANYGQTWNYYQGKFPPLPPNGLVVSNENLPTVYGFSGLNYLTVSVNGQPWTQVASPLPSGYQFVGTAAGWAATTDWATSDFFVAGSDASSLNSRVWMSLAPYHGTSWVSLTGTASGASGAPGMLKQDERVESLAVDPSSRAVVVGTDGAAPSNVYGASAVWRLNNRDVIDTSHHWRPWIQGFPFGTLAVAQVTGQYENGIFYYYVATWGRGVWKREARGGDL